MTGFLPLVRPVGLSARPDLTASLDLAASHDLAKSPDHEKSPDHGKSPDHAKSPVLAQPHPVRASVTVTHEGAEGDIVVRVPEAPAAEKKRC